MNTESHVAMVKTIFNRKVESNSNLFSDGRFWLHNRHRLFNGYIFVLVITGFVALVSCALLIVDHDRAIDTVEHNALQVQIIGALVQQTKAVRVEANHFLGTQQANDFAASELGISQLLTEVDQRSEEHP